MITGGEAMKIDPMIETDRAEDMIATDREEATIVMSEIKDMIEGQEGATTKIDIIATRAETIMTTTTRGPLGE